MKTYHLQNPDSGAALCDHFVEGDELVPQDEALAVEGRWFNCPKCHEKMYGRGRPKPPEET